MNDLTDSMDERSAWFYGWTICLILWVKYLLVSRILLLDSIFVCSTHFFFLNLGTEVLLEKKTVSIEPWSKCLLCEFILSELFLAEVCAAMIAAASVRMGVWMALKPLIMTSVWLNFKLHRNTWTLWIYGYFTALTNMSNHCRTNYVGIICHCIMSNYFF